MTDTLPSAEEGRSTTLRRFEQRRVEAEVRARLFGDRAAKLVIDRFEVRRKLGEGAMGIAYVAFDPRLQREVAIKLLDVRSPAEAQAALQEARVLARVSHANVLTVHEAGLHEGIAFIVSEVVAGGTLREWLAGDPGRRAPRKLLPMLTAVARGVAAAHQRGVAHRDLKPDNVLVGHDGRPRVADFGLAVTAAPATSSDATGSPRRSPLPGTISYMAPEQLRGERADPYSDQFGFCVMAFEALYGTPPFEGATVGDLLRAIEAGSVAAVSATHPAREVLPVLRRGLALDSAARWPSMDDLARALGRAGRGRLMWLGAAGALLLVAGGVVAGVLLLGDSTGGGRSDQKIIDKAISLNQAMRYDDCADYLETRAESDGAMQMWVGCAEPSTDPGRIIRACKAWPKRTKLPLPAACSPTLLRARELRRDGKFKECVETILAAPSTISAMPTLAACMAALPRDADLSRRICVYHENAKPPAERKADCYAGVKHIK